MSCYATHATKILADFLAMTKMWQFHALLPSLRGFTKSRSNPFYLTQINKKCRISIQFPKESIKNSNYFAESGYFEINKMDCHEATPLAMTSKMDCHDLTSSSLAMTALERFYTKNCRIAQSSSDSAESHINER